jgi:hypothetical protein
MSLKFRGDALAPVESKSIEKEQVATELAEQHRKPLSLPNRSENYKIRHKH